MTGMGVPLNAPVYKADVANGVRFLYHARSKSRLDNAPAQVMRAVP
ncbi:hypothetical protein C8E00_103401 [Chromohalobacter marismortui]|uniref:Uncharacterized protein n=1 Tax=Chromohalobacter marismortui TaxID=42055 RepID=A0A4R7NQH6_9GAMM|nr:hypothetical protein C8E00_103401 [Chromohalobacter marismortui]